MALTEVQCKQAKPTGKDGGDKLHDGGGMYLLVKAAGKYWRMDYRHSDKRKTLALGIYPATTLAQARKARDAARELLGNGIDPSLHKRAEKLKASAAQANSFQSVAYAWLDKWKVAKSSVTITKQTKMLTRDVLPTIGPLPITSIEAPHIVAIVQAVAKRGALDVANRVLNICDQVFRFAVAQGLTGTNPASFIKPADLLPQRRAKNHARIDAADLPKLVTDIEGYHGRTLTVLAMKIMLHTFVRTSELIEAPWAEIEWEAARWVIPADRMKMPTPHVVPLSRQVLALLRELHSLTGAGPLLFPHNHRPELAMSNNTILSALKKMGYQGVMTGHGFRGLASTILHESGFAHAHIELQLAHMERNKVSAAYNHSKYLGERAKMMQWWSDYCENCTRPNVVTFAPVLIKT